MQKLTEHIYTTDDGTVMVDKITSTHSFDSWFSVVDHVTGKKQRSSEIDEAMDLADYLAENREHPWGEDDPLEGLKGVDGIPSAIDRRTAQMIVDVANSTHDEDDRTYWVVPLHEKDSDLAHVIYTNPDGSQGIL